MVENIDDYGMLIIYIGIITCYNYLYSPEQLDSVVRKDVLEENETRLVDCLILPTETDEINDNNENDTSYISDDRDDGSEIIPIFVINMPQSSIFPTINKWLR